jgi:hypothetical protein
VNLASETRRGREAAQALNDAITTIEQDTTRTGWILHPHLQSNRENPDKGGKWSNTRKEEKCKATYLGEMGFDSKDSNAKGSNQSAYSSNSSAEGIGSAEAASVQLARLLTQLLVEKQKSGFVLYKSDS